MKTTGLIRKIVGIGLRIYFLGFFFADMIIVAAIYLSTIEEARAAFVLSIARGDSHSSVFCACFKETMADNWSMG